MPDDWPMVRGGSRSASTYDSHEIEAETKGLAISICLRQGRRSESSSDLSTYPRMVNAQLEIVVQDHGARTAEIVHEMSASRVKRAISSGFSRLGATRQPSGLNCGRSRRRSWDSEGSGRPSRRLHGASAPPGSSVGGTDGAASRAGMATTASVPGSVTGPIIENVTLAATRWVRSADRPWGLWGLGVLVAPARFGDR